MLTDEFKREPRYVVFKLKDIVAYLPKMPSAIGLMERVIHEGRLADGKSDFRCVVVESDWPEYEPTWKAIEARMTGRAIEAEVRAEAQQAARFVGVPTWPVASPRCPCCDTLLPRPTAPISQAAVAHLIRCLHPTGAPLPISAAGELVGRGLVERRGNFTMARGSAIFAATVKGEKMVEFIMASVRDAAFLNDD